MRKENSKIVLISDVDNFISHLTIWVMDAKNLKTLDRLGVKAVISKRNVLKAAGIEPNYYRAQKRGESLGEASAVRIIEFAKKLGYEL